MFHVRLAGDHLYGKSLFTLLSLMISLVVSYHVLYFFSRHALDENFPTSNFSNRALGKRDWFLIIKDSFLLF